MLRSGRFDSESFRELTFNRPGSSVKRPYQRFPSALRAFYPLRQRPLQPVARCFARSALRIRTRNPAHLRRARILGQSLKCKIHRQKLLAAASLTLMPSPTDPSERIAEVLREILFLTTERSSPAAPETKKEKDSKTRSSEPEQEPKS